MNVELKSVHSMAGDETPAFTASLYIDGKKAGEVRSGGTEGPAYVQWNGGAPVGWEAWCVKQAAKFHAEDVKNFPDTVGDSEPPIGSKAEEAVLFGLYARFEERSFIKRRSRKETLFRVSTETYKPGDWSVYPQRLTESLRRTIKNHYRNTGGGEVTFAIDTL